MKLDLQKAYSIIAHLVHWKLFKLLVLAGFFSGLVACEEEGGSAAAGTTETKTVFAGKPKEADGTVLAIVQDVALTDTDYRQQAFYFNPLSRLRSNVPEERLQAMVEAEVLSQEAMRQGIADRPQIKRQVQQLLIDELLRDQLSDGVQTTEIPEAEIKQYYDDHIDRYHNPARVRLAHILFEGPAGKREAESVLKDPLIYQPGGFAKLVGKHSHDDRSKVHGGDLGFLSVESGDLEDWQIPLVETARNISFIGAVAKRVVETKRGYHIVKLTGRQEGRDFSYDSVKHNIVRQLAGETKSKAYREFVEELKTQFQPELFAERLAERPSSPSVAEQERSKVAAATPSLNEKESLRDGMESPAVERKFEPSPLAIPSERIPGDITIRTLPEGKRPAGPVVKPAQEPEKPKSADDQEGNFKVIIREEKSEGQ